MAGLIFYACLPQSTVAPTKNRRHATRHISCFGGRRWIRFSAEKPRRLRRATGAPPRAGFRIHPRKRKTATPDGVTVFLVEEGGFEPPKSTTTDLQSAPFGHSGTPPYEIGAGGRIRTPDLLITNQLLYQLSYTSRWLCARPQRRLF